MRGSAVGRRALAAALAWCSFAGGLTATVEGALGAPGLPEVDWLDDLEASSPDDEPASPPMPEAENAVEEFSQGIPAATFEFPAAGSRVVTLGGASDAAALTADGVVELVPGSDRARGASVRAEVLDQATVQQAGVSGFVFTLTGESTALAEIGGSAGLPAGLSVDYSGFAEAFGAGYADRLRVVALPACALDEPRPEGCEAEGVPLPTRNDAETEHLVVEVEDLGELASSDLTVGVVNDAAAETSTPGTSDGGAADAPPDEAGTTTTTPPDDSSTTEAENATTTTSTTQPEAGDEIDLLATPDAAAMSEAGAAQAGSGAVVLAVTSGWSGATGDFAATPLAPSADWSVAPGSGEFNWSYDVPVPAPPVGTAPPVSIGYSSGAVDGMVSSSNTQSPPTGVGWGEPGTAFIERRYTTCRYGSGELMLDDLCWRTDNAVLSLNGVGGELVVVPGTNNTQWRVKNDPGWLVERRVFAGNGDNDGEHWVVTSPDGTQYFFGRGVNPDTGQVTNSTWWAPVFADDASDPCRAEGACNQAWRWNLDRVVDPHGITSTYFYFANPNHYRAMNGLGDHNQPYIEGGRLDRIEYGKPAGTDATVAATGRVQVQGEYRCNDLNSDCPQPNDANAAQFPDVPVDLMCSSTEDCLVVAPTFFTSARVSAIKTEVRVGNTWRTVDHVNLLHTFRANSDGDKKMYLTGIQRHGLSSGQWNIMPPINFLSFEKPNRLDVDLANGQKPMGHFRVGLIVDEYGHQTFVSYGQPRPCSIDDANFMRWTKTWDLNTKDCFPQTMGDTAWGWFHKYLVTQVDEVDPVYGSPTMTTSYAYEGEAAWHYNDDPYLRPEWRNWSDWRGYGTTTITQGNSRRQIRSFRGMRGDRIYSTHDPAPPVPDWRRTGIDVDTFDETASYADLNWFAGAILEERHLALDGTVLESSLHEFEWRYTAQPTSDTYDWAVWMGEKATTTTTSDPAWKRRVRTTYNAHFQPETVLEEGWLSQTGDERCTRTTYAENPAAGMFIYAASTQLLAGTCASTVELSYEEMFYDDSTTLGAAPSRGDLTMTRSKIDDATWATTSTSYDQWGRPVTMTDALGHAATTAYEAVFPGNFPTWATVTNPAGHVTRTDFLPERAVPLAQTDANGNVISYGYDGFGRLVKVWSPTEPTAGTPSIEFAYTIAPNRDAPPVVRTRRLTGTNPEQFEDTWAIYDSALRQRQTQRLSPESGKVIVSATSYDGRGLVSRQFAPQAISGTPGTILAAAWENSTVFKYDELGRVTTETWMRGVTEAWSTTTAYTHDTTTVTPPSGGASRRVIDGLGRDIRVEEHDGAAWRATSYGYDLADRLVTVTDPAGNVITNTYNKAGQKTVSDDPDAGQWLYGYDAAGNQTSQTDAAGATTAMVYDVLNRPVERRAGSPTGTLLASWSYDAAGELGLPDKSIRYDPTGQWTVDVTGYDARGRALGTTWTVPAGIPGLSGTYTISLGYDLADRPTTITYPAVGGLASETVTTRYNAFGLPEYMAGLEEYVWSVGYDNRARPSTLGVGPHPSGQVWMGTQWTYDADQRLARAQTAANGVSVADHQLTYDQVGNPTERATQLGTNTWRECFDYDDRQRLVTAYTVTSDVTCAAGDPGTGGLPYEETYSYSVDGRMLSRTENGTTTNYAYPAAGADRAHAPTSVGADTYMWGVNGNMTSRTVAGATETLAWDAEHRLTSVTGPDGVDSFVYDASGQRLLRTTPQGRTLYVAGHEINASLDGTNITATRSYSFGGQLIATRSPDGVDYLVSDQQGSIEASLPSGGSLETTVAYAPYGKQRSPGEFTTDQAWLGQIEDDSTSLAYLNARYADPGIGIFLSPDPLFDPARPKSLNPYSYGHNNPITNSDPTGLCVPINAHNPNQGCYDARWSPTTNRREIELARQNYERSYVSTPEFQVDVNRRRATYRAPTALEYLASQGFTPQDVRNMWQVQHDIDTLKALRAANPAPNFWMALNAVGAEGLIEIQRSLLVNALAGLFKGSWGGNGDPCGSVSCISEVLTGSRGLPGGFLEWGGERNGGPYDIDWNEDANGDTRLSTPGDGCSAAPDTGPVWDFTVACGTHDLGYDLLRSFGENSAAARAERAEIDALFLNDMIAHCYSRSPLFWTGCNTAAQTYYYGVTGNSISQGYGTP